MMYFFGGSSEDFSQNLYNSLVNNVVHSRLPAFTPVTRVQIPLGTPTNNTCNALICRHLIVKPAPVLFENGGFFCSEVFGG